MAIVRHSCHWQSPHLSPSLPEIQRDSSPTPSIIATIKSSASTLCTSSRKWPTFSATPVEAFCRSWLARHQPRYQCRTRPRAIPSPSLPLARNRNSRKHRRSIACQCLEDLEARDRTRRSIHPCQHVQFRRARTGEEHAHGRHPTAMPSFK
jgi:hypothetical protein